MNTALEIAVANYLTTKLTADATLSAVTYEVRAMTSATPQKKDRHEIIVSAQGSTTDRKVLTDVNMEIYLVTPAESEGVTIADHSLLEQAITNAFDQDDADHVADLSSAITAQLAAYEGGGFATKGWNPGREEMAFLPAFSVLVGVIKS